MIEASSHTPPNQDAVSIMIYVHSGDPEPILDALREMGFEDYDWCELRQLEWGDVASYGPCERREYPA